MVATRVVYISEVTDVVRDFKKFTSKKILAELEEDVQESRREWMLEHFRRSAAGDGKSTGYRFWQDGYHPEAVWLLDFYRQKLEYIHSNPVRQELVTRQEEYLYSSAVDYAGGKGLLELAML